MSDVIDSIPSIPAAASPVAPGTLDRQGVPFDAAHHIAKQHPKTGRWMPRGGRKPKQAAPVESPSSPSASSSPGDSSPSPSTPSGAPTAEAKAVTTDDFIPLNDAPKPRENAPDEKPIPEIGPGETAPRPSAGGETPSTDSAPSSQASASRPDVRAGHEVAAELASRVTYGITGAIIKDHKKATAIGEEHKAIKSAFAAFFEHRGVVFVGSIALVLILVSYLMGEARRDEVMAFLKQIFAKKNPPKPVVEVEAQPAPISPAMKRHLDPFSEA